MSCITLAGKTARNALKQQNDAKARVLRKTFVNALNASPEALNKIQAALSQIKKHEELIKLYENMAQILPGSSSPMKKQELVAISQYALMLKIFIEATPELQQPYQAATMLSTDAFTSDMGWKNLEAMISFYGELDAYVSMTQQS